MANQLYGTTGRKVNPNIVAQINSQTPYLPGLYRQKAEDALAKRGLDLQERSVNTNLELGQEQLDQQKKQARLANLLGLGNLGVKAGLGAYQASEPVRTAVDKLIGGGTTLAKETMPSGMSSVLSGSMSSGGEGSQSLMDWTGDVGNWITDALSQGGSGVIKNLLGDSAQGAASAITGSTPYADYITDTMNWIGDSFQGLF